MDPLFILDNMRYLRTSEHTGKQLLNGHGHNLNSIMEYSNDKRRSLSQNTGNRKFFRRYIMKDTLEQTILIIKHIE